jgi:WD40 repeat protein
MQLAWKVKFKTDGLGRYLAAGGRDSDPRVAFVWDLESPVGADPLALRIPEAVFINGISFDPTSRWAVTGCVGAVAFWPLPGPRPVVFSNPAGRALGRGVFTPDGSEVAFLEEDVGLRFFPTAPGTAERLIPEESVVQGPLVIDPAGRFAIVNTRSQSLLMLPFDGSQPRTLEGFDRSAYILPAAYDPQRELVAAAPYTAPREHKVIRVWSLRDGSVTVLGPADDAGEQFTGAYRALAFLPDGALLSTSSGSLRRWNLDDGSSEVLLRNNFRGSQLSPDGRAIAAKTFDDGTIILIDLETREIQRLPEYGEDTRGIAFGPHDGVFAAGSADGTIRVGRLGGGEPHLLCGHTAAVAGLAFSPDGRWLMSRDRSPVVRLWPVPDLSKPAPHTLPYEEFLAKLDEFTNACFVRDAESPTGWNPSITARPFPGWAEVPTW